jgi:hypothetical protein
LCVGRIARSSRARLLDPAAVPLLFFIAHYALIVLFLPLDWDRYYLPLLVATKVLIAAGACWTVSALVGLASASPRAIAPG